MIGAKRFNEIVYGFWARRFDCEPDGFGKTDTFIYPDKDLREESRAIVYHIGRQSVLRIDPNLLEECGISTVYPVKTKAIDFEGIQKALNGRYSVKFQNTLLDWFLDAKDHLEHLPPDGMTARRVDLVKDDAILRNLYASVTAQDLDEAEIFVDEPDPVIYGLFDGGRMTAYASHRYWEDVLCDIGVLVHPDYRSRGLGKVVVSALCGWCIENEKVPMYRVFDTHTHSCRIPEALGFQMLTKIESFVLSKEE